MAAASSKFNVRNPSVKRIMQEMKELQADVCPDFIADALEEDIFEWHFVIRGPPDTEFEGGIFHGRILLPAEYPFKPPAFMMLTPNGRFQTGTKICLSISSHHPEHWQPSWSVRTALTALIAFMPSPGQGAIGSLDFTKEERMQLAAKSRTDIPKFGSPARQKVIDDMHARFIELQKSLGSSSGSSSGGSAAAAAKDVQSPSKVSLDQGAAPALQDSSSNGNNSPQQQQEAQGQGEQQQAVFSLQQQQQQQQGGGATSPPQSPQVSAGGSAELMSHLHQRHAPAAAAAAAVPQSQQQQLPVLLQQQHQQQRVVMAGPALAGGVSDAPADRGLTFLIVVLSVAIAAMLLKKMIVAFGDVRPPMLQ